MNGHKRGATYSYWLLILSKIKGLIVAVAFAQPNFPPKPNFGPEHFSPKHFSPNLRKDNKGLRGADNIAQYM